MFQKENDFVIELTAEGVDEISKYSNVYAEDTKPISLEKRSWGTRNFFTLWTGIMVSIPVYMMASALIASNMTWYQALFICVLGHTLVLIPSILLGKFGEKYGVNFALLSKMTYGPKGTAVPTMIRAFMGCLWFGIQNWIGGVAFHYIIVTILPFYGKFEYSKFISFAIFVLINFYIGYHGSKAIKFLEDFAAPILIILSCVVIAWAFNLAINKGGIELLFTSEVGGKRDNFWKLFLPALTSMIAFDSTIALNFSDYTRFAKTKKSQTVGQLLGAPLMTAFVVFVGICGTSGSKLAFGQAFWDPSILVSKFDNPIVVILFSLLIILATLTTNVPCNLVSAANIFATVFTKKLNYNKAIIIVTIISVLFMPWKLVSNPESYVYTLNGILAVFLGPITGVCISNLWIKYKNKVNLVDLYKVDEGIYFYRNGWNMKAVFITFVLFVFIFSSKYIPFIKFIYDSSYAFGCIIAVLIYLITEKNTNK